MNPITIFTMGNDTESERLRVRDRLITLQDSTINSW